MDKHYEYIMPEYGREYYRYHSSIYINICRMFWNISFIKKTLRLQREGMICYGDIAIINIYRDEFELLVLRLHKLIYDNDKDTITLQKLKNNMMNKYVKNEKKQELLRQLKNLPIEKHEIKSMRDRVEKSVRILRKKCIAHSLNGEIEEVEVRIDDIEGIVMAAWDSLRILSKDLTAVYNDGGLMELNLGLSSTGCEPKFMGMNLELNPIIKDAELYCDFFFERYIVWAKQNAKEHV